MYGLQPTPITFFFALRLTPIFIGGLLGARFGLAHFGTIGGIVGGIAGLYTGNVVGNLADRMSTSAFYRKIGEAERRS